MSTWRAFTAEAADAAQPPPQSNVTLRQIGGVTGFACTSAPRGCLTSTAALMYGDGVPRMTVDRSAFVGVWHPRVCCAGHRPFFWATTRN
jgi:hypothetical protein